MIAATGRARHFVILALLFIIRVSAAEDIAPLKARATSGDAAAQLELAKAYDLGHGVKADAFEAADWYRKAADQGNSEAQNALGVKYRLGQGVPKDVKLALEWYRKAAKQANAEAMFNVGTAFYNGDGVEINDVFAFGWFATGAEYGSTSAADALQRDMGELSKWKLMGGMNRAAELLMDGKEVPPRYTAGIAWLNKSSALGNLDAQMQLVRLYLDGKRVPKDAALALQLCQDAAKRHAPSGMACLGYMYRNGEAVPKDSKIAFDWYNRAAACGEVNSIYKLSDFYLQGEGVKADKQKSLALLIFVSKWIPEAGEKAKQLMPQMPDKDVKAAQKQAFEMRGMSGQRGCVWE